MIPTQLKPTEIDFWIEPPLLTAIHEQAVKIARDVNSKFIENYVNEVKEALKSRVKKIDESKIPRLNVYAIDSSYIVPPLELVGGVLTVISYGYVGYVNGIYDRYVTGEIFFEDIHEFEKALTRRTGILERELAIKLLRDKIEGRKSFDLLIIDGELLLHPLPYNLPVDDGVLRKGLDVIVELIRLAKRSKTTLVGVVKRVRSRLLSTFIGKCTPVNDKVMLSLILNRGEYVVLGTFGEILPKWIEINYTQCEIEKRCKGRKVKCEDVIERMKQRLVT